MLQKLWAPWASCAGRPRLAANVLLRHVQGPLGFLAGLVIQPRLELDLHVPLLVEGLAFDACTACSIACRRYCASSITTVSSSVSNSSCVRPYSAAHSRSARQGIGPGNAAPMPPPTHGRSSLSRDHARQSHDHCGSSSGLSGCSSSFSKPRNSSCPPHSSAWVRTAASFPGLLPLSRLSVQSPAGQRSRRLRSGPDSRH